jgi:hypothetical protein
MSSLHSVRVITLVQGEKLESTALIEELGTEKLIDNLDFLQVF